jgi:uncharacterized protein (TIRG00374 family)
MGKRFRWREVVLGLGITGLFSVLMYVRLDVGAFTSSMGKVNFALLAPVLILQALAWWVRSVRWRTLLSPFQATPAARLFPIVIIGAMMSALVPGRPGEFWRAHAVGRREGFSRSTAFGTIVVERVLDGLILALLAWVALLAIGSSASLTILIGSMALLFAIGLGVVAVLAHSERARLFVIRAAVAVIPGRYRARAEEKLGLFMHGLRALRESRVLWGTVVLTVLIWVIEAASYWMLGVAFGLDLSPQSYLLVVAVANLALAIPISLGGIGPFEFFTQQSLALLGVSSSSLALAYAVSIHGLILVFVVLSGLLFVSAGVQSISPRPRPQPALASQD